MILRVICCLFDTNYRFCWNDNKSWCFYIFQSMFKVQLWTDMSLLFPFHVLRGASLSGVPLLCRCLGHPKKGDFDEWRGVLREESSLSHRSWLDDLELRSLQMMKRCKSQPLKTQKARLKIGGRRKVWLFVLFVLDTIWIHFIPIQFQLQHLVDITYDPVTGESRQPDQSSFPEASLRFQIWFFLGWHGPILKTIR